MIKHELEDYKILLRNVPGPILTIFVVSVILMNLLANREIDTHLSWLVLDCGFSVSWISFLVTDMLTKRFGAKASIKLSIFALCINLGVCLLLFVVTKIPGNWGEYYNFQIDAVNDALDNTFRGTWYVVLGSSAAFLVSSILNSILNEWIGKHLRHNNFESFAIRSFISTFVGQFIDNLVFALIVSYIFFGWSLTQILMCSLTAGVFELICEILFSPIGYKVSRRWERKKIGQDYIDWIKSE